MRFLREGDPRSPRPPRWDFGTTGREGIFGCGDVEGEERRERFRFASIRFRRS